MLIEKEFICEARKYLDEKHEEVIEWMKEIVEIESPTDNREAVNEVGAWVKEKIKSLGGEIEVVPSNHPDRGDHIVARFKGASSNEKPILLIAHLDTVWPIGTLEKMPFKIEGDKIYGPGVFDMKGGVIFALYAIKLIQDLGLRLNRPINILFNSDEEMNSQTSREIIDIEASKAEAVLVLEGGIGEAVITERKGILYFKVTATGKSSHAGMDHQSGVNAIEEISRQVIDIQKKTNYDVGTTVSCGIIHGGTRTNVVPEKAVVEVDARVKTLDEADRLINEMKQLEPNLDGAKLDIYTLVKRPPLERNSGVKRIYEIARRCAEKQGYELKEASTGAISDGNLTASKGIPTLDGLGPIGAGAHASHEHIVKSKINERLILISQLLLSI